MMFGPPPKGIAHIALVAVRVTQAFTIEAYSSDVAATSRLQSWL
jgi:hypothetical protein